MKYWKIFNGVKPSHKRLYLIMGFVLMVSGFIYMFQTIDLNQFIHGFFSGVLWILGIIYFVLSYVSYKKSKLPTTYDFEIHQKKVSSWPWH